MLFSLLRQGYTDPKMLLFEILLYFLALSLAFAGHEFSHALAAYLLGDDTAKRMGRLTLNPLAHTDLRGVIFLILLGFGWGKPVPVNPNNLTKLKNRRVSNIIVSLAGIFANLLVAFISAIACFVILRLRLQGSGQHVLVDFVLTFFTVWEQINICLLVFNLIPIPPLDGFKVIEQLLPLKFRYSGFFRGYCHYAPMIFFAIILLSAFSDYSIISYAVAFVRVGIDYCAMIITSFL